LTSKTEFFWKILFGAILSGGNKKLNAWLIFMNN